MFVIKGSKPIKASRRALLREEFGRFGESLDWVTDASLIPTKAAFWLNDDEEQPVRNPYQNVAEWMTTALAAWTANHANKLNYQKTFDKTDAPMDARARVRGELLDAAVMISRYRPGNQAMAEIVEIVPVVANREGIDRQLWPVLAKQAKAYGAASAGDDTRVQALIRKSQSPLGLSVTSLDPACFIPDAKTGITTVDDIGRVVEAAKEIANLRMVGTEGSGVCLALTTTVPGTNETLFDAVWDTFVDFTSTTIYPHLSDSHLEAGATRAPLQGRALHAHIQRMNEEYIMDRSPAALDITQISWAD